MTIYKLGEIATVEISGVDKKTKDGEIPVKLCNFVDVYYKWAITSDLEQKFMEATARTNEIERFKLKRGQVALTKDSETRFDIGIATYIADDFDNVILGYHNALITPNPEKLSGKYLNALLHTDYARTYFANNASGSGQRYALSIDALNNFPVPLIPLAEQERIGDIFSSIDQKIALNRAINDNLEAMVKLLYDYWFVQFDFPNEEGKPYKSSGGKMVWNDKLKREIPEGWEVGNLSDFLQVITERVSASTVNESTKYAPIEVLPRKKMSFNECAPIENAISGLCAFRHKNILLSNRRVYFHKVCIAAFDGITRDTVIVLKPNANDLLGYSYQLVNDNVFIEYATRHSYGSEQPVLSWESAKMYKVLKPKSGFDVLYSKCADSIIDCVIENELEIANLTKQRDELLPLLMNGQVSPLNSD